MKNIDFKEYGKGEMLQPIWHCLTTPDNNLKGYYNAVLNMPYNKKRFRRAGVFRNIGVVNDKNTYADFKGIRCLDMPIKMAGSKEYRIPKEFEQFLEPISEMIAFETAHNEKVIEFYAYLTIDQSEPIGRETHREPGLHVDGFQGSRIEPKVECDRSYIVFDCDCPSFWNQSFETVENMDESTQNIFHEFDRTKHYSSEIKCLPFNIYFMDSYAVHSANKAKNNKRTFCRLSFSVRKYDRLGNSHNHLFDYKWQMFQRDIHSALNAGNNNR
jgi:hypothetical protein